MFFPVICTLVTKAAAALDLCFAGRAGELGAAPGHPRGCLRRGAEGSGVGGGRGRPSDAGS